MARGIWEWLVFHRRKISGRVEDAKNLSCPSPSAPTWAWYWEAGEFPSRRSEGWDGKKTSEWGWGLQCPTTKSRVTQALEGTEFLRGTNYLLAMHFHMWNKSYIAIRFSQDELQLKINMWAVALDLHVRMCPGKNLPSQGLVRTHHLLWGAETRQAGLGGVSLQTDFPMLAVGSVMSLSCVSAPETCWEWPLTLHEALHGRQDHPGGAKFQGLRNAEEGWFFPPISE